MLNIYLTYSYTKPDLYYKVEFAIDYKNSFVIVKKQNKKWILFFNLKKFKSIKSLYT